MKTTSQAQPQSQTPSNGGTRPHYLTPLANIIETKDGYVLEAEMPGVGKDGLDITIDDGDLTIVGRRSHYESPGVHRHSEARRADFRRSFELDASIDASKISAKMDHGVLRLLLPKAETVKPRKIAVTE